jgi:hypothetical protein
MPRDAAEDTVVELAGCRNAYVSGKQPALLRHACAAYQRGGEVCQRLFSHPTRTGAERVRAGNGQCPAHGLVEGPLASESAIEEGEEGGQRK